MSQSQGADLTNNTMLGRYPITDVRRSEGKLVIDVIGVPNGKNPRLVILPRIGGSQFTRSWISRNTIKSKNLGGHGFRILGPPELDQASPKSIRSAKSNENYFPSDDIVINIVPAKIRARIFSALPLRVIKLPEMKLMERSAVAEYLIQNKLNNLTQEIRRRAIKIAQSPVAYASSLRRQKIAYHNKAISAFVEDVTKFAILSHTWGRDEPNYEEFLLKRYTTTSQGYKKLEEFCTVAHEQYGAEFAWADTVCINKTSSSELDESIRSMFTWYRESFICIIYLADTDTLLDLPFDRWFTRGWTLQELLASLRLKLYNKNWQPLTNLDNEKLDPDGKAHQDRSYLASDLHSLDDKYLELKLLGKGISAATGIPLHHICNFKPGLRNPPFPERVKWIAQRTTTRPEDMSYSMMGVLGVSIPVAYGEGMERAFFRLFQAVLEVDWSPSWFLWAGKPIPSYIHPSMMIPSSPTCYLPWDPACDSPSPFKKEPIALSNAGLPMNVLIIPARVTCMVSRPAASTPIQDAVITCPLSDDTVRMTGIPSELFIPLGGHQFALGVLDYHSGNWSASERVYAILLHRFSGPASGMWLYSASEWERSETGGIISFRLKDTFRRMAVEDWTLVEISPSEVGWGEGSVPKIEFRSLYL